MTDADCPLRVTRELGHGTYGQVSLVQTPIGPRALKDQRYGDNLNNIEELDILSRFRHPNLAIADALILPQQCQGLISDPGVGILMPLAQRTLNALPSLSNDDARSIMFQLLSGTLFLHDNNYLHLDLKPQNILCYETYGQPIRVAISDFGIARYVENSGRGFRDFSRLYVTIPYRPPENLRGSAEWSAATDMWSLGVIFLELLTRQKPTYAPPTYTEEATLAATERLVQNWDSFIEQHLPPRFKPRAELIELLRGMLDPNPTERWWARRALNSPYFAGLTPITGRLRAPLRPLTEPNPAQQEVVRRLLGSIPQRVRLGCYFLAMDLMFRAVGIAPDEASYEKYAIVARTLAYYMYRYYSLVQEPQAFIPAQLKLIVDLEGMVAPPYLFRGARNLAQLEALHPRFREIIAVYHSLDVDALFATVIEPFNTNLASKMVEIGTTIYRTGPGF